MVSEAAQCQQRSAAVRYVAPSYPPNTLIEEDDDDMPREGFSVAVSVSKNGPRANEGGSSSKSGMGEVDDESDTETLTNEPAGWYF